MLRAHIVQPVLARYGVGDLDDLLDALSEFRVHLPRAIGSWTRSQWARAADRPHRLGAGWILSEAEQCYKTGETW